MTSLTYFVSAEELAAEAGVTIRTIQNWVKAGYFERSGTNRYDILGYYRWCHDLLEQELNSYKVSANT